MANSAQARKRARQAEVCRQRNASQRSMMRTCIKKVLKALDSQDLEGARTAYHQAEAVLSRYANSGLIHANKAARHKSRLSKKIKALAAA